jgi:protein involved in polysaccharide export with SLBB domain
MKVSDLLTAAGGLSDRSYTLEAELTRFRVVDGKKREQQRWDIDLERILARPNGELDITLAPYDQINIRRIPNWDEVGTIEVIGEAKFPGTLVVARGEMLSNVIKRVGGLTDEAYPRGAIFTRESVRQREQEQLERLALQLEKDLVVIRAEAEEIGVDKERALNEARLLLQRIRGTRAVGRMVISLDAILQDQEEFDIRVQPGDKLIIRQRPEVVTVVGEVYHATTRLLQKKLKRDDVIRLSGGVTERGNKKAIFVVHADGSVSPPRGPSGGNIKMAAGDVIVVPLKVDRINKMKLITDITQIIFQLAFSAAAIAAID